LEDGWKNAGVSVARDTRSSLQVADGRVASRSVDPPDVLLGAIRS
jgi:hypothetical protein